MVTNYKILKNLKVGDAVKVGDVIGSADENALGVNIHASISGLVTEVNEKYIVIKAN